MGYSVVVDTPLGTVFRKTAAIILDEAGLTARQVADQLGHSRPSITRDVYMKRRAVNRHAAGILEVALGAAAPTFRAGKVRERSLL